MVEASGARKGHHLDKQLLLKLRSKLPPGGRHLDRPEVKGPVWGGNKSTTGRQT